MVVVWNWDGDGGRVSLFGGVVVEAATRGSGAYFGEDGLVKGSKGGRGCGLECGDDGGPGEDVGVGQVGPGGD